MEINLLSKPYKQKTCRCDGWWFPHRWGCKNCRFREEFIIERTLNNAKNLANDEKYWDELDDMCKM